MRKELKIAIAIFVTIFIIDQIVKYGFANFNLDVDTVIMAIGNSPNPLICQTTEGLEDRRGCIVVDEHMKTTRDGIYAGGDTVTGAATVILAMGAGKKAAVAMDQYLSSKRATK